MNHLKVLLKMAGGHALAAEDDGPARRTQVVVLAALAAAALCAIYGFAAGGTHVAHSLSNIYKVPMVVLLSGFGAVPAALVAWNLIGCKQRATDLVLGMAAGTLSGALVLAVLSPLVSLYYHTSTFMGPIMALGTASIGITVGMMVMVRTVVTRAPSDDNAIRRWAPVSVMILVHLLTILQLVSVSSIMVEDTWLDHGIEGVAKDSW